MGGIRSACAPAIIGLNFWGNHTIHPDTTIRMAKEIPGMESRERGAFAHRWILEDLIDKGFAVATAFRGEIVPESPSHYSEGILSLFPENRGQSKMGAIGTWAWALSRIVDYLEMNPAIDSERFIVSGHSRLGKSALWAAAQDTRFHAVFANNTGCMGAALSRREFGETLSLSPVKKSTYELRRIRFTLLSVQMYHSTNYEGGGCQYMHPKHK